MSTIDNKELIYNLIANDGHFGEDPRVYMIVEYTNSYGKTTYGVTWINEIKDQRTRYLNESFYVRNPKVIWHSEQKDV